MINNLIPNNNMKSHNDWEIFNCKIDIDIGVKQGSWQVRQGTETARFRIGFTLHTCQYVSS